MAPTCPDFSLETALMTRGVVRIFGVDEAGRGPLAGPVVAAAVRLDPDRTPQGLNDSKLLTGERRAELLAELLAAAEIGVGQASVEEIDAINILRATQLAMCRAIAGLTAPPDHALVDGNAIPPELPCAADAVVKGDGRSLSVAAASIVAKVTRDRIMVELAQQFPGYGWETNVGYSTRAHLEALQSLGPTPHHRRSFAPVYNILYQENSITR